MSGPFDDIFAKHFSDPFNPYSGYNLGSKESIFSEISDFSEWEDMSPLLQRRKRKDGGFEYRPNPKNMPGGKEAITKQPDPEDNWYKDYLDSLGSSFMEYSVGGAGDLLDLGAKILPAALSSGGPASPYFGPNVVNAALGPSTMSQEGQDLRSAIRDKYEEDREGLSDHGPFLAGATSIASDLGALGLDAILTGGLGSGSAGTKVATNQADEFAELAARSLKIAPEIPPSPLSDITAETITSNPFDIATIMDDFIPANDNISRQGLHAADDFDITAKNQYGVNRPYNYTDEEIEYLERINDAKNPGGGLIGAREPVEGLPGKSPGPPTIREPYKGTPKDIKYKFYGTRQIADYEAAVHNIQMRKDFGDQNLIDGTFYLEGTGNPYAEKPFNSHADVVARLKSTEQGQALMDFIDNEWPKRTQELYDSVQALGFADDMGYVENYIKHVWEVPDIEAKRFSQFIQSSDPFMRGRHIATYEEGIARGYQPKTVNFADLVALTERAYGNVRAAHTLLDEVHRLGAMPDGLPAVAFGVPEKGAYKKVNIPAIAKLFGTEEDAGKAVYMHQDLWDELRPVLTVSDVTKTDQAVSMVKAMNLSFSLFHGATLFESALSMFGPTRGMIEAGRGALGIPVIGKMTRSVYSKIGNVAEKAGLENVARVFGEPGIEVAKDGMLHGLQIGRPETDVMQGAFFQQMDKIARQGVKLPLVGKSFYKDINFIKVAKKTFDTALWDNYHTPMKISAYQFAVAKLKQAAGMAVENAPMKGLSDLGTALSKAVGKVGLGKKLSDLSETELKRAAAAFVNDEFGGQAWELLNSKLWNNPKTTRVLRRIFTSPDWNVSSVRSATASASSNPARRALGNRHYINAAIGYFGFMNALNYMMSGHFMWDNEPGKELHLQTWYTKKDANGHDRKVFWNVGKQFGEAEELVFGRETSSGQKELPVAGFLARKILPLWQSMVAIASGKTISGFPSEAAQLEDKKGRPLTGAERLGATGKQIGSAFLPFNVQRLSGDEGITSVGKLLIPYPESSGINKTGATARLYQAYKDGDAEAAQEIIDAMYANGYSQKEVDSAISSAQKMLLKF